MKLLDLFEMPESAVAGQVSDWNISPRDMQVVYDALRNRGELDISDVTPLAKELVDEHGGYSKNTGSARFLINRMHTIMHNMAPLGVTEHSAEQFMTPARPLIAFMAEKGYNTKEAINLARDEARTRLVTVKHGEALKQVVGYYRQNKPSLNPQQDKLVRTNKDQLVKQVETGVKVEDAFQQLLQ